MPNRSANYFVDHQAIPARRNQGYGPWLLLGAHVHSKSGRKWTRYMAYDDY